MTTLTRATFGAAALALSAFAAQAGDIEAGASAFQSQCQNCHNVTNAEGDVLAGRPNVRTGPNLYGVIGRQAGTEDFRYGASLVEAGEAGLVWTAEDMVPYLLDPTSFLRETLGNNRARSQMSFRVRDDATAENIIAFLAQFGAVEEAEEDEASGS
ncbi:MAG: c-type cytochrome [Roseinatronobacter sp.]